MLPFSENKANTHTHTLSLSLSTRDTPTAQEHKSTKIRTTHRIIIQDKKASSKMDKKRIFSTWAGNCQWSVMQFCKHFFG